MTTLGTQKITWSRKTEFANRSWDGIKWGLTSADGHWLKSHRGLSKAPWPLLGILPTDWQKSSGTGAALKRASAPLRPNCGSKDVSAADSGFLFVGNSFVSARPECSPGNAEVGKQPRFRTATVTSIRGPAVSPANNPSTCAQRGWMD